ncbi:MAG: phosphoglycerate dehydrogenase [Candidatus Omnitrophica bacterium]|nr:phosphoglycerate dehydrogenase [Candidatus Omnitrophota bacterium]
MAFKILVSDPLAKAGVEILEKEKGFKVDVRPNLSPEEIKRCIGEYDALIVRSQTKVTKEILSSTKKLKYIGRAGVGLDNIDVEEASKRGIVVMNAPGGNTISTAEHAFSLILALSRKIPQANESVKKGEWERKKFMGVELYGKTLGIIGFGRIGTEVARRALSFNMKVVAYDPFLSPDKAKALGIESVNLEDLFKRSDYITVHTPHNKETHYIIKSDSFKKMKKGVRIINCARGGIIDEEALLEAIEKGRVAGAALDVYEKEPPKGSKVISCDKIITTPHLGASTEEAQVNVALDVAESIKDALTGRGIRNAVNAPSIDPEVLKVMEPYLSLAEKIGKMQAQLAEGYIKKVKVKYVGEAAKHDPGTLTRSVMKGMLEPILEENVNYVNAPVIAKERGIKIIEEKTEEIEDFANLVIVEIETERSKNFIMGTLFTKVNPRIVKINQHYVEVVPQGHMLVIRNQDKPGIVGHIGTLLGAENINIAGMTFGRAKPGGDAVSVLNIDSAVSKATLEKIKKAKYIKDVKAIKL